MDMSSFGLLAEQSGGGFRIPDVVVRKVRARAFEGAQGRGGAASERAVDWPGIQAELPQFRLHPSRGRGVAQVKPGIGAAQRKLIESVGLELVALAFRHPFRRGSQFEGDRVNDTVAQALRMPFCQARSSEDRSKRVRKFRLTSHRPHDLQYIYHTGLGYLGHREQL
jgi:hypothetical protein